MPNLTLGREGTQFHGDGVSLAWPRGKTAQIVPAPEGMSIRMKRRIAEGSLVLTEDEATHPAWVNPGSRVLSAEEVRRRRDGMPPVVEINEPAQPAAPLGGDPVEVPVAVPADAPSAQPRERKDDGQRVRAGRGRTSHRRGGRKG